MEAKELQISQSEFDDYFATTTVVKTTSLDEVPKCLTIDQSNRFPPVSIDVFMANLSDMTEYINQ